MASEVNAETDADRLARELQEAAARQAEAEAAVEEIGEDRLDTLEGAANQLARILDQYEESATGSGDFEAYMECRMAVQDLDDGLEDDIPNRAVFAEVAERFDSRRLSDRDFSWAWDQLDTAREPLERLQNREQAREQVAEARRAVLDRMDEVEEKIEELETVRSLGKADLEAPIEELQTPIETYDEAVTTAFERFLGETSAREVFAFLDVTTAYPLISVRQPPQDLATYIDEYKAGTEPIPTLLEYAEYSRSKLDHYVEEPMELKRHVATHRTYLTRLDASPFTIGWPPPSQEELRYLCRELVSIVARFADEETMADLHTVRATARREDYPKLRAAARATTELTPEQREALQANAVEPELETLREEQGTLQDALEDVS